MRLGLKEKVLRRKPVPSLRQYSVIKPLEVDTLYQLTNQINDRDTEGKTSLHHACVDVNMPRVLRLLAAKADPRIKDNNGETALISLLRSLNMCNPSNEVFSIVKEL